MKKSELLVVFCFVVLGIMLVNFSHFVIADDNGSSGNGSSNEKGKEISTENRSLNDPKERSIDLTRERDDKNRTKIRIKNEDNETETEIESDFELEKDERNNSRINAILKNGTRKEIKILPYQASKIAFENFRSRNITVELKEVNHKNIPRVVYLIKSNKNGRFLGIFKLSMKVEGEIDPDTGKFTSTSKPWWAFLVIEVNEEPSPGNQTSGNTTITNNTLPGNVTINNTTLGNETLPENTTTNSTVNSS